MYYTLSANYYLSSKSLLCFESIEAQETLTLFMIVLTLASSHAVVLTCLLPPKSASAYSNPRLNWGLGGVTSPPCPLP